MASGSGWNLWVWLVGVVVRRYVFSYYLPLLLLYLFFLNTSLQHPYFLFIFKMFFQPLVQAVDVCLNSLCSFLKINIPT